MNNTCKNCVYWLEKDNRHSVSLCKKSGRMQKLSGQCGTGKVYTHQDFGCNLFRVKPTETIKV